MECRYYEEYPFKIVFISLAAFVLTALFGTLILWSINKFLGFLYIVLTVLAIPVSMKFRCGMCYYYGKRCYMGLGLLTPLFFKKGDPLEFGKMKNLIPAAIFSFGLMILAIIAGIVVLIINFSVLNLVFLILYIIFSFIPGFILKKNYCSRCRQGEMNCPAYEGMKGGR